MIEAVIFDLDGTTLRENIFLPQATCITEALSYVAGTDFGYGPDCVPEHLQVDWTGQTDWGIATQMLQKARLGVPLDDLLDGWARRYERLFLHRCPTSLRDHVTDGWPDLLENVERRGWENRVVTGNVRQVAILKLRRAGLHSYFNLPDSGYGDDRTTREAVLTEALRGLTGAVVVGDTWRDIDAAKACGVPVVAFKTPRHTVKSLRKADAIAYDAIGVWGCICSLLAKEAVNA
jgi:phosphoglycolate phosphatase